MKALLLDRQIRRNWKWHVHFEKQTSFISQDHKVISKQRKDYSKMTQNVIISSNICQLERSSKFTVQVQFEYWNWNGKGKWFFFTAHFLFHVWQWNRRHTYSIAYFAASCSWLQIPLRCHLQKILTLAWSKKAISFVANADESVPERRRGKGPIKTPACWYASRSWSVAIH